jgi:hypothetical protein
MGGRKRGKIEGFQNLINFDISKVNKFFFINYKIKNNFI